MWSVWGRKFRFGLRSLPACASCASHESESERQCRNEASDKPILPLSCCSFLIRPQLVQSRAVESLTKRGECGLLCTLQVGGVVLLHRESRILSRSRVGTSPLRMSPAGRPVVVQSGGDIGFTPRLSSLCSCSFSHSRCSAEAILRAAWACRRHCRRHRCVHRLETVAKFNQPGEAGD